MESIRTSPYNASSEATHLPESIKLNDITLREGQQAPSVAFKLDERIELGRLLDDARLPHIQAGFAGRDEPTAVALKKAHVRAKVSLMLIGFGPNWKEALVKAAGAGVDVVEVVVRSGEPQLRAMAVSHDDSLRQVESALEWAVSHVPEVWFCPSFASFSDQSHLLRMLSVAQSKGARHFNLTDSTGSTTPTGMRRLVRTCRDAISGATWGIHCHDDFGLAVANTIAGIEAGAVVADVSVNGYGERAGNCPLEVLVVTLELLYGIKTGVRMERLTPLSRWAADATKLPLARAKPVSGEDAFAQKLDRHVQLTEGDGTLLEPYPPHLVGNRRTIRLGVGTGPIGVRKKLAELGLAELDDNEVGQIVEAVNRLAEDSKQVTDSDFIGLMPHV